MDGQRISLENGEPGTGARQAKTQPEYLKDIQKSKTG